jgi:hypothetical protein
MVLIFCCFPELPFLPKNRKEGRKMETIVTPIVEPGVEVKGGFERRSHSRFEVQPGVISSLQLTVVGQTLNISWGGLVFQYVASRARSAEPCRLSISLTDRSFNLGMIPFKRVWDVATPDVFSYGTITSRYCGVAFGELLDFQILALQFLIQNYTTPAGQAS